VEFRRPEGMRSDAYELDNTVAIKAVRRERAVYYIDGQKISRKALRELVGPYFHYLSVRDRSGFENETLLDLLDRSRSVHDAGYGERLAEYRKRFLRYESKRKELESILAKEREARERMEFLRFEIGRIEEIAPRPGEYEELLEIKRKLSRIDRITEAVERASVIFDMEGAVGELFDLMERDSSYFSDAMNQLRSDFEEAQSLADELLELDVEEILERLEKLSDLIRRYGSIEEALAALEEKRSELEGFEHIEADKSALEEFLHTEEEALLQAAEELSEIRRSEAAAVEKRLARALEQLKLPPVRFRFEKQRLGETGTDRLDLDLEGSSIATLSGGEFNRLRLALMSVALEGSRKGEGVVFLDEIDANVSGDESIAIAEMIAKLSEVYQIFAISHQPHLSARASQHILVKKEGGASRAILLEEEGRLREISRIVGGERADEEALAFAGRLLKKERNGAD